MGEASRRRVHLAGGGRREVAAQPGDTTHELLQRRAARCSLPSLHKLIGSGGALSRCAKKPPPPDPECSKICFARQGSPAPGGGRDDMGLRTAMRTESTVAAFEVQASRCCEGWTSILPVCVRASRYERVYGNCREGLTDFHLEWAVGRAHRIASLSSGPRGSRRGPPCDTRRPPHTHTTADEALLFFEMLGAVAFCRSMYPAPYPRVSDPHTFPSRSWMVMDASGRQRRLVVPLGDRTGQDGTG